MTTFLQMLINKVVAFWDGVEKGFTAVCEWANQFYSLYTWAVWVFLGLLWFAITYIWDVINWLGQAVPQLMTAMGSGSEIGGQQMPGPLSQAFAVANAFFPLTEAFGFAAAIGPIWMTAVLIRCVKAWVPGWN